MQRLNLAKLPWILLILGGIVWGTVACGSTPQVEPSPIVPTPTSAELASPILPTDTLATPTALSPQDDLGGARGVIAAQPASWNGTTIYVYFAPFYSGESEGQGFYVLEPTVHPSAVVGANGTFQLNNIPPAQYVILAGPSPEQAQVIRENDQPKVFDIVAGVILDLGDLRFEG